MIDPGFRTLRATLAAAGCFEYRPGRAVLALAANLAASGALLALAAAAGPLAGAPLFLAGSVVFYRLGWLMHDGAHGAVFGRAGPDRAFTLLVCLFLGELPSGWAWGHNRHHFAPNVRGVDGDQAERWAPNNRTTSWTSAFLRIFLLRRVAGALLPRTILMLWLRDGLYAKRHTPKRFRVELPVAVAAHALHLVVFALLFGAWALPLYLLHTHIGLVYLNAVFLGNHYDLPSWDAPAHKDIEFAELQVRTARNYPDTAWHRWLCGGLEHQIEHHLFPDLPRHGLRRAAPHVRAYCAASGLPYEKLGLLASFDRAVRFHLPSPAVAA